MFWDNYDTLCRSSGKSPNFVAQSLGFSTGTVTWWKKGKIPQNATLKKIADYFGVTVDYLLGNTNQREATVPDIPDDDAEDIIIYHRDGKTVRKRLPKAEYEAAIKMLEALGDDNPDL